MLRLKVNGQERVVEEELDPAIPLLWVLRDHLGLVGSKYGCGAGSCGACTVQLDGAPVRSCTVLAAAVGGVEIVTIEGLATSDNYLHPLQQAWIEIDVPQCGYCQAGQLMSAAALLRRICGYRCRNERQSVSLRNLSAYPRGHTSRSRNDGGASMPHWGCNWRHVSAAFQMRPQRRIPRPRLQYRLARRWHGRPCRPCRRARGAMA